MNYTAELQHEVERSKEYAIVVEGKKDVAALDALGFEHIYAIHQPGVPLRERVVEISEVIGKKQRVCILTDFDKKGKQLYLQLKSLFMEQGVRLDSRLRGMLLRAGVSHIEGVDKFFES